MTSRIGSWLGTWWPRQPVAWICLFAALFVQVATATGQTCGFCALNDFHDYLDARYVDDGCAIQVDVLVTPIGCGSFIPGIRLIRVYKNAPSNLGGQFVGQAGIACEASGPVHVTINPWPSPGATAFFVEAWIIPGDSNGETQCLGVTPDRLAAVPPGDSDGDGIDTCADNCPTTPNSVQVNVDSDETGDVCDSTKGDCNYDGVIDDADLAIFLACFGGDGEVNPPQGCSLEEFECTNLHNQDMQYEVDFADLAAFQVFYRQ